MRLKRPATHGFALGLFARMAMILLAGLFAAQLASLWLQWDERAAVVSQARGLNFVDRLVEAVRLLEATAPADRAAVIDALKADNLSIKLLADTEVSSHIPRGSIQSTIGARLGSNREIRSVGGGGMGGMVGAGGMGNGGGARGGFGNGAGNMAQHGGPMRTFDLRLNDGQWVRIAATGETAAPALSGDLVTQLLITLAIVTSVVMIAVRQATLPLKKLAQAADTLGRDLDAPPLPETGPAETRRAAQAFNHMQARIRRLVDERARALAAVSHDLRTPLTRLRLRTELVEDDKLRDQMEADLDAMATMIDATLDYLRGLQVSEALRPIDMNALVQSLTDDMIVLGKQVGLEGSALAPYTGRLSALRRGLQNLIDNANGRQRRFKLSLRVLNKSKGRNKLDKREKVRRGKNSWTKFLIRFRRTMKTTIREH